MDLAAIDCEDGSSLDTVILVHGTYAAEDSDEGASWWQRGSAAWRGLRERLPAGVQLPERGRLFHWSGENSERARIKAAGELLSTIEEYESHGRGYHLVGHSHGGSVIWHTLRLATLKKKALEGLRSWSTVGTPFMHHRTKGAFHYFNVFKILLALLLIRPAIRTVVKLCQLVSAVLFGTEHGVTLSADGVPGWIAKSYNPAFHVLELFGVPVAKTAEGLRIGTFDPTSGQSVVEYVFLTPEGWLILVVALLAAYVYLNLAVFCISPVLESLRIRQEKRFEKKVMDVFQRRWLGLWSPDDEAINGLRATLQLSVSFVSRMAHRESILLSDRLSVIARPHRWLLEKVYNALFRPALDGIVRSQVVKTAQGNNRPAAEVIAVSPTPVGLERAESLPAFPAEVNARVVERADHHARDIAPKLRALLAEPSFVSGLERFGNTISGRELVHTSYFDHDEVLDLLAFHIAWARGQQVQAAHESRPKRELNDWLLAFKAHLVSVPRVPNRELIAPRRKVA